MFSKKEFEEMVDGKSCIVCARTPDLGVTCAHGPCCSKERSRFVPLDFYAFSAVYNQRESRRNENDQTAKADAGKLQISMVPTQIVRDIAEVRMYGNRKYGDPNNWKLVELSRYVDAMLRHTLAFWEDPHSVDEESGIPHYKHAECNWAFISEFMKEAAEF